MDTEPYIQQVGQYIQQQRQQGVSVMAIRNQLRRNGWNEALVNEAFRRLSGPSPYQLPQQPAVVLPSQQHLSGRSNGFLAALKSKAIIILVALVVCGAAALIASLTLSKKNAGQQAGTGQNNSSAADSTSGPSKNDQEADAKRLAAGISEYINEHSSTIPTTADQGKSAKEVKLCELTCSKPVTVTLKHYKASGVLIQGYQSGLRVSDPESIYIVTGASCSDNRKEITLPPGDNVSNKIAIAYSYEKDKKTVYECLAMS